MPKDIFYSISEKPNKNPSSSKKTLFPILMATTNFETNHFYRGLFN
jgi:hypothetical protein